MPLKYDIITIGSAMRDVFLVSDELQIVKSSRFRTGAAECVPLGSKIEVDKILLTSGGGATNAAATFSSLGFKTATICRIGDDMPGKEILQELKFLKIDTKHIDIAPKGKTGYSTILTESGGERSILVYRGVAKKLTAQHINWKLFEKTRWVYLTSLGGNVALAKRIVMACKKNRIHIAWNPGRAEIENDPKTIMSLLDEEVDVFNLNREEAALLTKKPATNIMKLFARLSPAKHRVRIITDGANGAYLCNGASCYKTGTSGVKGISRTGAGDAFGSGIVAGFLDSQPVYTSLRIGTLNAEGVIQSLGAKQGLLTKFPGTKKLATIPFEII